VLIGRIREGGLVCAGLCVTAVQPGAEGLDAGQELRPCEETGWRRKLSSGEGLGGWGSMWLPHRQAP
jgi:hypothetical protein